MVLAAIDALTVLLLGIVALIGVRKNKLELMAVALIVLIIFLSSRA